MAYHGSGSQSPGGNNFNDEGHRLQDLGHSNNTSVSIILRDDIYLFEILTWFFP
jgi:hypothetical protein